MGSAVRLSPAVVHRVTPSAIRGLIPNFTSKERLRCSSRVPIRLRREEGPGERRRCRAFLNWNLSHPRCEAQPSWAAATDIAAKGATTAAGPLQLGNCTAFTHPCTRPDGEPKPAYVASLLANSIYAFPPSSTPDHLVSHAGVNGALTPMDDCTSGATAALLPAMDSLVEGDPPAALEAPAGEGPSCGGTANVDGNRAWHSCDLWPPACERLAAVAERLRARPRSDYPPVSNRCAAVLVGLFEDRTGVVRVLLTQRSARLNSHRGEVCLPGGKRDEGDVDDVATALREAHEELGIDPALVTVLGCLPPVLSKHHLSVTPVLAILPPDTVPVPNPHEVAAAFTVPLAIFLGQTSDPRVDPALGAHVTQQDDQSAHTAGSAAAKRYGKRRQEPATSATGARGAAAMPAGAVSWRAAEGSDDDEAKGEGGANVQCDPPTIAHDNVYENAAHKSRDIAWGKHKYRIHSFVYGEFDVWGLTATICITAARVALGREPSFQEICHGGHHYSCFYFDGSALQVRPGPGLGC